MSVDLRYSNPRCLLTTDGGFGPVEDAGRSTRVAINTGIAAASAFPGFA